jgi:hypothetical protein
MLEPLPESASAHVMGRKELLWAALGAIASVVAVILTVYGFYFTHHEATKELEGTVLARSQILNSELHQRPNDVRLLYKNREISNASIFQVRLRNSGAQPIAATEIEQPIQINLIGATDIISATVISQRPPDLPVTAEARSPASVILSKTLLNPDDTFIVEIVTISSPSIPTDISGISGRIAGVRSIVFHKSPVEETSLFDSKWLVLLGIIVGTLGSIITSGTRWILERAAERKSERRRREIERTLANIPEPGR